MKKKILVMAGYYIPSVKGGGPIQSIKNLVDNLSEDIEFYIIALDRDLGDDKPFKDIEVDKWISVGKAKVYYINKTILSIKKIKDLVNCYDFDVLYLNSFFDAKFSIIPLLLYKFNKLNVKKIVLAPRGQLSSGALGLKTIKKKIFLKISIFLKLHNLITWHSTALEESKEIEKIFGSNIKSVIATNFTQNISNLVYNKEIEKRVGEIKIVFISRVHPKKNLSFALEILKNVKGIVEFDIFGPIEEIEYWEKCKKIINSLPNNIKVNYKGTVAHENVIRTLRGYHIFFFPTLGENFGHVIAEALIAGCPIIISDQTPWRNLEEYKVGYDIDLKDTERFIDGIQKFINMDKEEYYIFSKNSFSFLNQTLNTQREKMSYINLFETKI